MCQRNVTITASSSKARTVEPACLGPVGRSATEQRLRHLAMVFALYAMTFGQRSKALLNVLYRTRAVPDPSCLLLLIKKYAPSSSGTLHLDRCCSLRLTLRCNRTSL